MKKKKAKSRRAGKSETKQGEKNRSKGGPGKEKRCHEYKIKPNKARQGQEKRNKEGREKPKQRRSTKSKEVP